MEEETWDHMVQLLRPSLKVGVTMRGILSELHGEVTSGYEDTLRRLVGRHTQGYHFVGTTYVHCVDRWTDSDFDLSQSLLLFPCTCPVQQTLVKPNVKGLSPDNPLPSDPT